MTTQDLIARLEGAESGGNELDAYMVCALQSDERPDFRYRVAPGYESAASRIILDAVAFAEDPAS